eukprot:Sspe_Gene.8287::Locus_2825_Transcript_1_1_Confidence_1.000_Length_435::g.8287::m.8287
MTVRGGLAVIAVVLWVTVGADEVCDEVHQERHSTDGPTVDREKREGRYTEHKHEGSADDVQHRKTCRQPGEYRRTVEHTQHKKASTEDLEVEVHDMATLRRAEKDDTEERGHRIAEKVREGDIFE